ncbi:MAG: sulfite exporter TauE/SafE family protein [Hydrogenophilales bacterium CG_4_10_14_3_um_filter_63_21]|nr:MAG: sulfite exporter TauE/SafE family protein [Hydrogenophilales bacterium CG_4_10_14_3_um_filter_63_21]
MDLSGVDLGATHLIASGLVFVVAGVFAMLGLGGGMLYVPLFKWLELPLKTVAIPLGLLLNGVTSASALARYAREGLVDFRGGLPAALAAMAMAPLGAHLTQSVPKDVLIGLFAALTAMAGFFSLRGAGREETPEPMSPRRRMAIGLALGGGEGFVGALLGVGGGFIVAPVLMMLGFGAKQAAGTTAFIVTFASVSGFAAHAAEGHIEPLLAALTVIAALAGSQLGAWFMAKRAKPGWVKRLYAVLLLGVAAKLIFDIVRG